MGTSLIRTHLKNGMKAGALLLLTGMLVSCSDGDGAATPQVDPGPSSPNDDVSTPTPTEPQNLPNYYEDAVTATATITGVTISSPPVVEFQLVDEDGVALTGLTSSNLRAHIAKLKPPENGNAAYWQSYINRLKTPAVHPENDPAVQATSESGGELVDNGDGTYSYTFATDITSVTSPMEVTYEPDLTHRVGFQFSGGPIINPIYDWVPATGATSGIVEKNIVATETCNTCHDPLAMHGGGRQEVKLCVVCHNPGTSEPNSGEDMDMAVLIHRIHQGVNLPSVQNGGEFVIYGYRDSRHDYSDIVFPQDTNNCAKCHTGSATADHPITAPALTSQGDNWAELPTMSACGSCHDDLDFSLHAGGQTDNSGCQSCHSASGPAGTIASSHANLVLETSAQIAVNILSVTNTAPGDFPVVQFSVTDPTNNDAAYDLATHPFWTDTGSRLRLGIAWNTDDFTNTGWIDTGTGEATVEPEYARTDALASAVSNGDGTYTLTSDYAIPDGSVAPFRAASGSGMAVFEGRARLTDGSSVPFDVDATYFSIDESDGQADARRSVVTMAQCNNCHGQLALHGGNRTDPEAQCQGCHNPRFATAAGESIDFKRMIHGIHSAAVREDPLVIRRDPFDTEVVQFPGEISDCTTCHAGNSYKLPLASSVLASTIDMGTDLADPSDDVMISRTSAVCSSCHDSDLAQAHMEQNGGDFSASETSPNRETCEICHGDGRSADVEVVHIHPFED